MKGLFANLEPRVAAMVGKPRSEQEAMSKDVIDLGTAILREARPEQIAEELRHPSTNLVALREATQREAFARILTTCAL